MRCGAAELAHARQLGVSRAEGLRRFGAWGDSDSQSADWNRRLWGFSASYPTQGGEFSKNWIDHRMPVPGQESVEIQGRSRGAPARSCTRVACSTIARKRPRRLNANQRAEVCKLDSGVSKLGHPDPGARPDITQLFLWKTCGAPLARSRKPEGALGGGRVARGGTDARRVEKAGGLHPPGRCLLEMNLGLGPAGEQRRPAPDIP